MAVWASLALCVCYSLSDQLPRYRTETASASWSSAAPADAKSKTVPLMLGTAAADAIPPAPR
jgi:hypothetical protein